MSAYANAKALGRDAVLEKIAALDLAALNNADTDMIYLELLKKDPEKVLEGCAIAALAAGAVKAVLTVPEKETELAQSLQEKAAACGVEVVSEFINIRKNQANLLVHLATCADLADAFDDCYEAGIYVSVNGEALKKVPADAKVSEIVDLSEAKAVQVGYAYYTPQECEASVGELNPANGVIRVLTEKNCIVDDAAKKLLADRAQSCGKCVFCREGLIQLEFMQTETTQGRGKMEFLDLTKEIGEAMCYSTPCSMGQQSARIALSCVSSQGDAALEAASCRSPEYRTTRSFPGSCGLLSSSSYPQYSSSQVRTSRFSPSML